MKQTALRFGSYGVYTILAVFFTTWLIFRGDESNFKLAEVIGWAGILLSVIFVYFGLKYYRDKVNHGSLTFGEGLKLGLLIVLLPALAFGIFDVVYVTAIDPQYLEKYYSFQVEQLRTSVAASELPTRLKEMEEQKATFTNPLIQFIVMALSVFAVGLIVTVLSTLILKRKRQGSSSDSWPTREQHQVEHKS